MEHGDLKGQRSMIESNLRLVHALARAFSGSGVAFDDLMQEGTIGLIRPSSGSINGAA